MIKHFLDCWDFSTDELLDMVDLIIQLKKGAKKGNFPKVLSGQSVAMIFNGNSTRTRISFEVATHQLGGHALYLTGGSEGEMHLGKRETVADTARVVSSMVEGVVMRWRNTGEMEDFAANLSVPFFNAMDHTRHPTQTLCDLVTVIENLPEGKELKDITLAYIGQSGVRETSANDIAKLLPRFGAKVIIGSPVGYELGGERDNNPRWMIDQNLMRREIACEEGGGAVIVTNDPQEAVHGADFVYTGCVCYEGCEAKEDFENFKKTFIDKGFQVNEKLLSICPTAKTMHYLPALRGQEISDFGMDFNGSLLWKQAENRLHTQRGLLAYLMWANSFNIIRASNEPDGEILAKIASMDKKYGGRKTH